MKLKRRHYSFKSMHLTLQFSDRTNFYRIIHIKLSEHNRIVFVAIDWLSDLMSVSCVFVFCQELYFLNFIAPLDKA